MPDGALQCSIHPCTIIYRDPMYIKIEIWEGDVSVVLPHVRHAGGNSKSVSCRQCPLRFLVPLPRPQQRHLWLPFRRHSHGELLQGLP